MRSGSETLCRPSGTGGTSGGGGEKDGGVWLTGGWGPGALAGGLWWGRLCRRGGMKSSRVGKVRGEPAGAAAGTGGPSGPRGAGGLAAPSCPLSVLTR